MSVRLREATPTTFDALVLEPKDHLVLVDFWGEGCPNCDVFARDLPELLSQLGDAELSVVRVDAYQHPDLARRFGLFGIPAFLLFRDGKLLGRMSQYYGRDYWLAVIRERLAG